MHNIQFNILIVRMTSDLEIHLLLNLRNFQTANAQIAKNTLNIKTILIPFLFKAVKTSQIKTCEVKNISEISSIDTVCCEDKKEDQATRV